MKSLKKLNERIQRIGERIKDNNSEASSTATFKCIFKSRHTKYLKIAEFINNTRHLKAMVRLRLSDHYLMIEKGRRCRPPITREERLCPTCGILGEEIHFLIDCTKFIAQRQEAFRKIINITPNFENIPNSRQRFTFLLSQENITAD